MSMKQFIDKLISRLEELRTCSDYGTCNHCQYRWCSMELLDADDTIKIINELAEEYNNDFCEWKFTKSVVNGECIFSSGCNHKRFSDLHNFEFCPYCGKKIKVVTIDG